MKMSWEFLSCGHFYIRFIGKKRGWYEGWKKVHPNFTFEKRIKTGRGAVSVYGSRDFYSAIQGGSKNTKTTYSLQKKTMGCVFVHFVLCHLHIIGVYFFSIHTWKMVLNDFAWMHLLLLVHVFMHKNKQGLVWQRQRLNI